MRVYIGEGRHVINAELIQENFYTAWVRIFGSDVIKRHKRKHCVDFEYDKAQLAAEVEVKRAGFRYRLVNFIKNIFKRRK